LACSCCPCRCGGLSACTVGGAWWRIHSRWRMVARTQQLMPSMCMGCASKHKAHRRSLPAIPSCGLSACAWGAWGARVCVGGRTGAAFLGHPSNHLHPSALQPHAHPSPPPARPVPQAAHLKEEGGAVRVMAHAFEVCPGLHARLGLVLEAAELLGAASEAEQLQVGCACACVCVCLCVCLRVCK